MNVKTVCTPDNLAWERDLYTAYHYTDEDGHEKTVMKYQIPFAPEIEAIFMVEHGIEPAQRRSFYANLVRCIQRQIEISEYLTARKVPSILSFSKVEQEKTEDGVICIYLETERIWPITYKVLHGTVSQITLLDIVYRLAIILRDISKEDVGVVHRGLDINEVFINKDNRICLGGFHYAFCPALGGQPDYLPGHPVNLPKIFLHGETGNQAHDVMALAIMAWNLFSGVPFDAKLPASRLVYPEYATDPIVDALLCGMTGNVSDCNLFRRKLADSRKLLNKSEGDRVFIPVREQALKEFRIEYIDQGKADCPENTKEDTHEQN